MNWKHVHMFHGADDLLAIFRSDDIDMMKMLQSSETNRLTALAVMDILELAASASAY